ncbi:acetate--CoA ligase [Garicola koreensis]|uniref:acetate--CoA ligase n=1 Tax=Garicola koreensis TaxID=1262554 RepID=A0A7W5XLF5_9MICC|nr:acetate--CoA ligase [Garicola koreensis]MBB3668075.1 acetyl-CoA synthetase [Garicola koreensis]
MTAAPTTGAAAAAGQNTPTPKTTHPCDADVHNWADPATESQRIEFWERAAGLLDWEAPWHTTHTWSPADPQAKRGPQISWFSGGTLNASVNCVDRHVAAGRGERTALHFEGEPGDRAEVTYADLQDRVNRAANALESLGIGPGDRVVIYLPVLVETIVITLACARIGAVHQLVFGGFSAEALRFRIEDTGAKLLVTTDGQFRRGKAVPVKANADEAVSGDNSIEHVLVIRRTGSDIRWVSDDLNGDGLGRDLWWHEVVDTASAEHTPEFFDAEHPLFIMYTSGTTGKPKGLVHTTGGYLTGTLFSYLRLFAHPDPTKRDADVHWCTADLAWVTAHTYEIYGPLAAGATQVIYEGVPNVPHPGRHFEIIDRHRVTSYYTAPTLVRSLMGWFPDGVPEHYDLRSIRLAGTVGEAVNPEAASWLRSQIGRDTHDDDGNPTLPLVDTWWQSESGSTVLSPRPETTRFKPGSVAGAMPGWEVAVVNDAGAPTAPGVQGNIVITKSGPSMARTVWGNPERFYTSYWQDYAQQGWFLAGDGAQYDAEDDIWILGRIDDAINVSGHLLSTIEIESALISHPDVVEAGVAGVSDPTTGQAAVAFTVLSAAAAERTAEDAEAESGLNEELRAHVGQVIGPVAKPRAVIAVPEVPKTRSGKIMRRLLAQIHDGEPLGDTTSLQNEPCVAQITEICRARGTMSPAPTPATTPATTPTP